VSSAGREEDEFGVKHAASDAPDRPNLIPVEASLTGATQFTLKRGAIRQNQGTELPSTARQLGKENCFKRFSLEVIGAKNGAPRCRPAVLRHETADRF
jgi:hypothetical protein